MPTPTDKLKEEIKKNNEVFFTDFLGENNDNAGYNAMDEYAEQQAIAFAEWIEREYWHRENAVSATDTLGKWFNIDTENKEWQELDLTTKQLYTLFLNREK